MRPSQNLVLLQYNLKCTCVELGIFGNLIDDVCKIGEEISTILVGEDSRHTGIVEFDLLVMDADEMFCGVFVHQRFQSVRYDLGYRTLGHN